MSPVGCKPPKGLWSVVQPSRRIEVPSQNMLHGGRGSERETRKPWVQTGLLPRGTTLLVHMLHAIGQKKKKSHIQGCLHGAGKDMILLRERQVTQFTTAPPHPLPQHTHTSALWNWGSVLLWNPKHTGVLLSVLFLVISLSARCQAKCFPSSRSAFNVTLWTPCGY